MWFCVVHRLKSVSFLHFSVDEELPDYIMVMIANKRTKEQMSNDLDLFLGENTNHFTNWYSVLYKWSYWACSPDVDDKFSSPQTLTTNSLILVSDCDWEVGIKVYGAQHFISFFGCCGSCLTLTNLCRLSSLHSYTSLGSYTFLVAIFDLTKAALWCRLSKHLHVSLDRPFLLAPSRSNNLW